LYETTRDPEGVLSTIPAVATCLLGLLTGEWLRSSPGTRNRSAGTKAAGMAGAGVLCVAAGEFFNIWFPINKKLWTSSYVLFTAGLALACLALCYWALDIRQWRGRWSKPFLVFGKNAIAAYVLSEILASVLDALRVTIDGRSMTWHDVVYEFVFVPLGNPANASLLYSIAFVLVCWAAVWVLYRKGIFLKI
jgi:predicted acyltransferase